MWAPCLVLNFDGKMHKNPACRSYSNWSSRMVLAGPIVPATDSRTGYRTRLRATPRTRPEEQHQGLKDSGRSTHCEHRVGS